MNRDKLPEEQLASQRATPRGKLLDSLDEIFNVFEMYKGKDYGSMTEYRITKVRLDDAKSQIKALLTTELLASSRKAEHSPELNSRKGKHLA